MKKNMLFVMAVMAVAGGSAWPAGTAYEQGGSGTAAVNDITLVIEKYCSVDLGTANLVINAGKWNTATMTAEANADATCLVQSNFAATITPVIVKTGGYDKSAWTWTPTIDGKDHKDIIAGATCSTVVNVALSSVALKDAPVLTTPAKVAVLTVTITPTM